MGKNVTLEFPERTLLPTLRLADHRARPVIAIRGAKRSGKTQVLRSFADQLDGQRTPFVLAGMSHEFPGRTLDLVWNQDPFADALRNKWGELPPGGVVMLDDWWKLGNDAAGVAMGLRQLALRHETTVIVTTNSGDYRLPGMQMIELDKLALAHS